MTRACAKFFLAVLTPLVLHRVHKLCLGYGSGLLICEKIRQFDSEGGRPGAHRLAISAATLQVSFRLRLMVMKWTFVSSGIDLAFTNY